MKKIGAIQLVATILLIIAASCKRTSEDSLTHGAIQEGQEYLWPNATASVCWERMNDPEFAKYAGTRAKIAALATSEFSRAGFTFTGWGACEPGTRGIRIIQWHYKDDQSLPGIVKALGRRLDGLSDGVGFDMEAPTAVDSEASVLDTALHEMGHAIGMLHEANRQDSPCYKDQFSGFGQETWGMLPVGGYDADSIMNYCANLVRREVGSASRLSTGDIATIRKYYAGDQAFPRQKACQEDGHSWKVAAEQACCLKSPSGRINATRLYQFCDEPSVDGVGQRNFQGKDVVVPSPALGWTPKMGVLRCSSGESVWPPVPLRSNAMASTEITEIKFWVRKSTSMTEHVVNCSRIDFYDQSPAMQAQKVARYDLNPPRILNRDPEERLDLAGLSPRILEVQAGVVQETSQNQTDAPDASIRVPEKIGGLGVSLSVADPAVRILGGGYLTCEGQIISSTATENPTAVKQGNLRFAFPQDAQRPVLKCQSLRTKLVKYGEALMEVRFKKELVMRRDGTLFMTAVPVPECVLAKITQSPQVSANPDQKAQPPVESPSKESPDTGSQAAGTHADGYPFCSPGTQPTSDGWGWDPSVTDPKGGHSCHIQGPA